MHLLSKSPKTRIFLLAEYDNSAVTIIKSILASDDNVITDIVKGYSGTFRRWTPTALRTTSNGCQLVVSLKYLPESCSFTILPDAVKELNACVITLLSKLR